LCPYHKEKTPYFTVNDVKGFYHCFGCGAHGDAIRWLTEHEGMRYPEAVEQLANEIGLSLPQLTEQEKRVIRRAASLQEVTEAACSWFEQQLQSSQGRMARDYLQDRGLSADTIRAFRIGFVPEGRDGLKKHLLTQNITEAQLIETGLVIKPDQGNTYDRFRARVMFPILDRRGNVIAFGGRILPQLAQAGGREAPKYLNSPETALFHKGQVLYNYERARQPAHKAAQVLVAEGYMDVIALAQAGIANAVAPLGTAVTADHIRLLWNLADEPVLCLDGDMAGNRAMERAAALCLPLLKPGKSLRLFMLPQDENPDTLPKRHGKMWFHALTDQTSPLDTPSCPHLSL